MPSLSKKANQKEFAEMVGVTQQAISKNSAIYKKGGSFKEWLLSYCHQLRQEAAGRDSTDEMRAVTIREKTSKAVKTELETSILAKTVVDKTEVMQELLPAFDHIKSVLISSGEKIVNSVEVVHGITIEKRLIDDEHTNALSEFAKYIATSENGGGGIDAFAEAPTANDNAGMGG